MKEHEAWNLYDLSLPYAGCQQSRAFPWLYPYGTQMDYRSLWNSPEQLYEERDRRRLQELYPLMARRLQPYVEEVCSSLEYPGSMMYDEYPDQLSLLRQAKEVWNHACAGEDFGEQAPVWEEIRDLIAVLLLQEMIRRRRKNRGSFGFRMY